jgi:hypothetical protein
MAARDDDDDDDFVGAAAKISKLDLVCLCDLIKN